MLSPLKPLLCRHEFYWSERHRSDLCRRCGKTQAVAAPSAAIPAEEGLLEPAAEPGFLTGVLDPIGTLDRAFFEIPPADGPLPAAAEPAAPVRRAISAQVLKAQARERRENLLALLDRIAEGGQPSRRDSLDVVLAVIEDAHSADPVLFGSNAAGHFARLHEARSGLIF